MAAAVLLGAQPDEASAAALGGAATSFGLLAALSAVLVVKVWQAHLVVGSLSTAGGLLALVAGVALIWRYAGVALAQRWWASEPAASATIGVDPFVGDGPQVALPAGIDRQRLLAELHRTFLALQTAWDIGTPDQLGQMTTPEMLEELCSARSVGCGVAQRSEVVTLDARVIAFEEVDAVQLVCVEFSGSIRDSSASAANPFREFWMLTRGAEGSGSWRLARHQALL